MPNSSQKLIWPLLAILLLSAYQLSRVVAFVNVYGGIEHDGGWMLSISRSLAEQGTYTTMVSTITDPAVPAGINVDQKFDIQAPDGRIWFFTGNGIGPASIIPGALILKLFGTGFWALHLGPLLFFTVFMLLAAILLYRLAGLAAVGLFHAFLFFYPHLSIFLSYEAMGEVPAMAYILAAYLLFAWASQKPPPRSWAFLVAGLAAGLALSAKLIALWSVSGIFIWAGLIWLAGLTSRPAPDARRSVSLKELLLLGGALLPLLLWELVHLVVLARLTSFELYLRHLDQRLTFILDDGSGIGLSPHSGAGFFWDKFFVLAEAAHPERWVTAIIFGALVAGGATLLWLWRGRPQRQNLLGPLWLGWVMNTAWFVGLAKTGWPRHYWFGLVLAVMLLPVIAVAWLRLGLRGQAKAWTPEERAKASTSKGQAKAWTPGEQTEAWTPEGPAKASTPGGVKGGPAWWVAGGLLLALIGWGFASQPHVWGVFIPDEIVPYWREKQLAHKYGASLPWLITPRAAQAEAVAFLQQLPPEARIYYPAQHKAAEISAQVGRVLYPLTRRKLMKPHPQDVALVSPTLIAPWLAPARREALLELVRQDCPQPLLQNDYYMICPLPLEPGN